MPVDCSTSRCNFGILIKMIASRLACFVVCLAVLVCLEFYLVFFFFSVIVLFLFDSRFILIFFSSSNSTFFLFSYIHINFSCTSREFSAPNRITSTLTEPIPLLDVSIVFFSILFTHSVYGQSTASSPPVFCSILIILHLISSLSIILLL